ncbi:MAG: DEAD/DEAH box helicase [Chitinispirillia bacterium]|nr:DEAD/DEAH box helicase [Chitinispirillia bacterium]
MEKFKNLGLSDKTLGAVNAKGFEEPTEIQSLVIPVMLGNECDLIAQAQTGTGKTAAFALPLIELLDPSITHVQAVILAPTRELVLQVCEEINSLKGRESRITVAPIYGGQAISIQLSKLKKGVSIAVGTPGRVIDLIERGALKLQNVRFFVLDEADEMLNMGFIEDIERILSETPQGRRTFLFSATMPERIKKLAAGYMKQIEHVKTKTSLLTGLTDQIYYEVAQHDRFEALCRIVDMEENFYGIVFCRMKTEVDELVRQLGDRGYSAEGLHGDISQAQREQILGKFRKKTATMLVATDVAARGIDISNLSHVINYGLPQDAESYVHRIGRTGRAGSHGTAITFITSREFSRLGFIKRSVNASMRRKEVPEVSQIIEQKRERITKSFQNVSDLSGSVFDLWARELLSGGKDPQTLLASVLKNSYGRVLDRSSYRQITPVYRKKEKGPAERSFGKDDHPKKSEGVRLFIALGRSSKATKKLLSEFIVNEAGIDIKLIEDIQILDRFSFVTVPLAEAEIILSKFKNKGGKDALIQRASPTSDNKDKRDWGDGKRGFRTKEKTKMSRERFSKKKRSAPKEMQNRV